MVDVHLNTRVTPEAYRRLLLKCARLDVSPYTYLRELIHRSLGHHDERPPTVLGCKRPELEAVPRTNDEQILYIQQPEYLEVVKYLAIPQEIRNPRHRSKRI